MLNISFALNKIKSTCLFNCLYSFGNILQFYITKPFSSNIYRFHICGLQSDDIYNIVFYKDNVKNTSFKNFKRFKNVYQANSQNALDIMITSVTDTFYNVYDLLEVYQKGIIKSVYKKNNISLFARMWYYIHIRKIENISKINHDNLDRLCISQYNAALSAHQYNNIELLVHKSEILLMLIKKLKRNVFVYNKKRLYSELSDLISLLLILTISLLIIVLIKLQGINSIPYLITLLLLFIASYIWLTIIIKHH